SYKHHVVPEKPTIGICCDAGTRGNPGPAEYNVADLNGKILEHKELGVRTNNYAELSGILAALNYCKANGIDLLWTDSQVSMQWIENGQPGKDVHDRDELIKLLSRIDHILSNTTITIRKWHTDIWGEIPADFGRK
ncbi:MAG: hypothetical protein KDD94_14345, partial [Calditrichaeota bacterium]|nr:hypothetical protein [Calditrichota bacterium]